MGFRRSILPAAAALLAASLVSAPSPAAERRITPRTIKVGVHGPFTGAVPLPQESIEQGARVFWKWRRRTGRPIHGRHVEVVVRNDNYNPTQAMHQCRQMIRDDRVAFMFGFFAGVDQMQTCARLAARRNIPYLSLGMTRTGLTRLRPYFAITATWKRQSRVLAAYLADELGARREKNGIVFFDTPNYADAQKSFVRQMEERGAPLDYVRSACRCSTQTEAQQVVAEMKALEIQNVYMLVSPVWFMQVLQAARTQDYNPTWVGIGNGIAGSDEVAKVGCRNGNFRRNRFVSPLPAFADRSRFDRDYGRAMKRIYGERGDHVTWLGWATAKAAARLLKRPGRNLTRRRFVRAAEDARRVRTGILPPMSFRPRNHFGGRGMHVLHARCRDRRWHTMRSFVTSF